MAPMFGQQVGMRRPSPGFDGLLRSVGSPVSPSPTALQALVSMQFQAEGEFVAQAISVGGYHTVVEVGCCPCGKNVGALIDMGVRYVGLNDEAEFLVCSPLSDGAEELRCEDGFGSQSTTVAPYRPDGLLASVSAFGLRGQPGSGLLVLLAMNALGRLHSPEGILREAYDLGADLCVMTFGTCQRVTEFRKALRRYRGRTRLDDAMDTRGVWIEDETRLQTYAYHPDRISGWLRRAGFELCLSPLCGPVGRAFWARQEV